MAHVYHMVVLRFKPGHDAKAPAVLSALAKLKDRIPGIVHYAGGPYSSPEGMNQGYTHGFLMTFANASARDVYLTHPEHEAVKTEFLPFVEAVVAFDFVD